MWKSSVFAVSPGKAMSKTRGDLQTDCYNQYPKRWWRRRHCSVGVRQFPRLKDRDRKKKRKTAKIPDVHSTTVATVADVLLWDRPNDGKEGKDFFFFLEAFSVNFGKRRLYNINVSTQEKVFKNFLKLNLK